MKTILITLVFLLSLLGCQDNKESQAEHDAKIIAQAKAEVRAEIKAKQEKEDKKRESELQKDNKLNRIGITTNNGKLIIDTNKTKNFFQKLALTIKSHAEKFSKDMEKGVIDNKEAGIEVDNKHINIDLNKTKSFLDRWGKIIEGYAKEFDKITKDIDK